MDRKYSWDHLDSSSELFLKTQLFGFNKKNRGNFLKEKIVYQSPSFEARYTGEYLTQFDRDISLCLKKLSNLNKLEDFTFQFSLLDIMHLLRKKCYGKRDKQLIHDSLVRHSNLYYSVQQYGKSYEGKSIKRLHFSENTKTYIMQIEEEWVNLFNATPSFAYNIRQRLLLSSGLARWLHGLWSVYDSIPVTTVEELMVLSGSEEKVSSNFKKTLSRAMNELIYANFLSNETQITPHNLVYAKKA